MGVGSLLLPYRFQVLNSGRQPWQQVPLFAEPSNRPLVNLLEDEGPRRPADSQHQAADAKGSKVCYSSAIPASVGQSSVISVSVSLLLIEVERPLLTI